MQPKQVSQSMVDEVANELMTYDNALFLDPEKTVEIPIIQTNVQTSMGVNSAAVDKSETEFSISENSARKNCTGDTI